MAIILMDGFDYYTNLAYKWPLIPDTTNITVSKSIYRPGTIGQTGSLCFNSGVANLWLPTSLPTTYTTLMIGFAYKWSVANMSTNMSNGAREILQLKNGTTLVCALGFMGSAPPFYLCLYSNVISYGSPPAPISAWTPVDGTWYYIEISITIVPSTIYGTININIDGSPITNTVFIVNNTNLTSGINAIALGTDAALTTPDYFDDLYVCNTSGTVNNTLLGNCRITTVMPAYPGSYSTWTPTSGANYTNVSEVPDTGDSSTVATSIANTDSYKFTTIPVTPLAVYGLQMNSIARKTPGTKRQAQNIIINNNAIETTGITYNLPEGYNCFSTIVEQLSGVTWVSLGVTAMGVVNSTQFGIQAI